jgi:hypothetical protein
MGLLQRGGEWRQEVRVSRDGLQLMARLDFLIKQNQSFGLPVETDWKSPQEGRSLGDGDIMTVD